MRLYWLAAALVLTLLMAFANEWALRDAIYYLYPWFDTIPHTLGGAAIGTLVIALWPMYPRRMWYLFVVALALVSWEVFEYIFRTYGAAGNYVLDTASDLLFGTLGAIVPYGVARLTVWRLIRVEK